MGIKHLLSWCVLAVNPSHLIGLHHLRQVDTLAVDLNEILYRALHRSNGCEKRFLNNSLQRLRRLIRQVQPSTNIGIFMDGPASHSKIITQIKRRRAAPPEAMEVAPVFSRLALTCGTPTMRSIAEAIFEMAKTSGRHIRLSTSEEPGEGEVKIVKWLKTIAPESLGNIVVFGSDADLIPICCAQPLLHRSRVCFDPTNNLTIPVRAIREVFGHSGSSSKNIAIQDIAVLMILLGNDYLPRLAGLTPDIALKVFSDLGFPNLVHYDKGSPVLSRVSLIKFFKQFMSRNIEDLNDNHKKCCPEKYFKGVAWVIDTYVAGECPDYTFHLNAGDTISVRACYEWLLESTDEYILPHRTSAMALDSDVIQLLVTPLWGRSMISPHLRSAMDSSSEIGHLYQPPCPACAAFRQLLSSFQGPSLTIEDTEFRRSTYLEYSDHVKSEHPKIALPVNDILKYLANSTR